MNEGYQYIVANQDKLAEIVLGVIFLARMIAALTPSKRDDEVVSSVEKGFRKVVELVSGAGHRNLIQPESVDEPAVPQIVTVDDEDPFEAFSELVNKFGGKIVIIPKDEVK